MQDDQAKDVTREMRMMKAHQTLLSQFYSTGLSICAPSRRSILLFASVRKLVKMAGAVSTLAAECFVEEILAIGRTMAEIIINAAYLQVAEDEEVDRFQHFDTQSAFRHATRLRPHTTITLAPEELTKIQAAADHARAITGRKDSDLSWSKRTLLQRAEFSDNVTQLDLMRKLVLTSYAYGHSAVHGTFDSLDYFINRNSTENSDTERIESLRLSISGANFSLYVMCLYLNSLLRFNADAVIDQISRLQAFDSDLD